MIDYLKLASLLKQQGGGDPIEGNPLDQFLPQDENSRALVDQVLEDKGSSRMGGRLKEAMGEAQEIAANPMLGAYKKIKGDIDEVKGFAKDNLSMMGGMAGTLLMSQALEDINGQFERQRNNEAYKRNLAQKSYDPITMFEKGGKVELFQNGGNPFGSPFIREGMFNSVDDGSGKGLYGQDYYGKFKLYKSRYEGDDLVNMTDRGRDYYKKIFNFSIPEVSDVFESVYSEEYGEGAGDKIKNYLTMVMVNENSYGQRPYNKDGKNKIEGRDYTGGFISADKNGHAYDFLNKMTEALPDIKDREMSNMSEIEKSYVLAAKMLRELGMDPMDKESILERILYGEPIASMAITAAQGIRGLHTPKGGAEEVQGVKIPKESRDKARAMHKGKSDFINSDASDMDLAANMFLNSWNTWGNLRKRNMDPNESVRSAKKEYEYALSRGWNSTEEKDPTTQFPEIPYRDNIQEAEEAKVKQSENEEREKKESKLNLDLIEENNYSPVDSTSVNMTMPLKPFKMNHGGRLDRMESFDRNKIGKVVSFRDGGKVHRGVIIGYKNDKPIIRKYTDSQGK